MRISYNTLITPACVVPDSHPSWNTHERLAPGRWGRGGEGGVRSPLPSRAGRGGAADPVRVAGALKL